MSITNVRVKNIRKDGYDNLREWMQNENNIYIGRKGVVFIDGTRYPPVSSEFCNPYKIDKNNDRNSVLKKYKKYIIERLCNEPELLEKLLAMKNKNLGCWCAPDACHGDILLSLIEKYY